MSAFYAVLSGVRPALHWRNTLLREFGDSRLNHIELRGEEDEELIGLDIPDNEQVMDLLREALYPRYFMPIADPASIEFCATLESYGMDSEIDRLFDDL